jgi:23S rRNA C2498 (ribose-2'-O)-methylase RlmM
MSPQDRPPHVTAARPHVLQVCRVAGGVWTSFAPLDELSDPWPGGVHRMPEDPAAPSRSVLKLEEALDVMGVQPQAGERVVDLGAAPGGWSWACVKRGCSVTAVDNGPLSLTSLGEWGGELTHRREDGLRFRPERPVDWLLSDMLIAPGQALGLLRKWHAAGWARRYIVNFKLPQREAAAALAPICDALDALPGLRYRLRQLYHDRREVTLMGESTGRGKGDPYTGTVGMHGHRPRRSVMTAAKAAANPPDGAISASRRALPKGRLSPKENLARKRPAPAGRTNHPRRRGRQRGGRRA